MSTITIQESVVTGGRVDEDAGVIFGAKLLGPVSANGRRYSRSAMKDAARLYVGKKICLDHNRQDPRKERSVLEEIAVVRNAWENDRGVFGDVHFFKKHSAFPLIMDRAKNHADTFGFSHNADGNASPDGRLIESLTNVRTIDLVGGPATSNGIFESRDGSPRRSFRELLESDPLPTAGDKVATESDSVDSAVAASLDEFLPAETYTGLKWMGAKSISRAFESAVALITKDSVAPTAMKAKAIKDLLSAKDDFVSVFTKIVERFSDDPVKDKMDYAPEPTASAAPTLESRDPITGRRRDADEAGKRFAKLCR